MLKESQSTADDSVFSNESENVDTVAAKSVMITNFHKNINK